MRNTGWAITGIICAGLVSACGNASSPTPGAAYGAVATMSSRPSPSATATVAANSRRAVLTVKKTKIGYVLANAGGYTLYWYGKDVKGSGTSACTGTCVSTWPPLSGKAVAKAGVKLAGKLGFITRGDGTIQATYNGYPLYTYSSDMAPGDTLGNGMGGMWHVITGKALGKGFKAARAGRSHKSGSGHGSGY